MATVTLVGTVANSTAGVKTIGPFAATVDALMVCLHGMSGWASGDNSLMSDDNPDGLGGTWARLGTATAPLSTGGGTACALWVSVRNALVGDSGNTTWTLTNTNDTGGFLNLYQVSGMTRVGLNAIRQSKGESSQTESPPTLTFPAACLTTNPVFLAVMGEDNPPNLSPPTGITEQDETGYTAPVTGIWTGWASSGITASVMSWTGGALTDHNEVGVELDSSVPTDIPLTPSMTRIRNQLQQVTFARSRVVTGR